MFTLEEYTPQIILDDLKRLQYLYGLKNEIRFAQSRAEKDVTESVAEHIYGMHICALYFLPLENPEGTWDKAKIYEMMTIHDIDEIETGDVLGYLKDESIKAAEVEAMRLVMEKSPSHMHSLMSQRIEEYEARLTKEALFAKAIDKIEPLVQCFNPAYKSIIHRNKTTVEDSKQMKDKYLVDFPFIKKFGDVIQTKMVEEGFFYQA